jgi:hypothetical protein
MRVCVFAGSTCSPTFTTGPDTNNALEGSWPTLDGFIPAKAGRTLACQLLVDKVIPYYCNKEQDPAKKDRDQERMAYQMWIHKQTKVVQGDGGMYYSMADPNLGIPDISNRDVQLAVSAMARINESGPASYEDMRAAGSVFCFDEHKCTCNWHSSHYGSDWDCGHNLFVKITKTNDPLKFLSPSACQAYDKNPVPKGRGSLYKKHKIAKGLPTHSCDVCGLNTNSEHNLTQHSNGRRHKKNMDLLDGLVLSGVEGAENGAIIQIGQTKFELIAAPQVGDTIMLGPEAGGWSQGRVTSASPGEMRVKLRKGEQDLPIQNLYVKSTSLNIGKSTTSNLKGKTESEPTLSSSDILKNSFTTVPLECFSMEFYMAAEESRHPWWPTEWVYSLAVEPEDEAYPVKPSSRTREFYENHSLETNQIESHKINWYVAVVEVREVDGRITHARLLAGTTKLRVAMERKQRFVPVQLRRESMRDIEDNPMQPCSDPCAWECASVNTTAVGMQFKIGEIFNFDDKSASMMPKSTGVKTETTKKSDRSRRGRRETTTVKRERNFPVEHEMKTRSSSSKKEGSSGKAKAKRPAEKKTASGNQTKCGTKRKIETPTTQIPCEEGDWLGGDDIIAVTECLLNFTKHSVSPGCGHFGHFIGPFVGTHRPTRNSGKLRLQIVNTDNIGGGIHWFIMAGQPLVSLGWVAAWEPLNNIRYSRKALTAAGRAVGKENLKINVLGQQTDGWRCGYYCAWWWLHLAVMVREGVDISDVQDLPPLPEWWCEMVWELLRRVDEVKQLRTAHSHAQSRQHFISPITGTGSTCDGTPGTPWLVRAEGYVTRKCLEYFQTNR